MTKVAEPSIYTLPFQAVPPSENTILAQVLEELQQLREEVQALQIENQNLRAEIIAQDQAIEALALDIARDRKRLTALEALSEPQPLQKDRGEILRALIAANDGKMLATEARKMMRLSRTVFSRLLDTQEDYIEIKPFHLHKNWQVLVLK
jgi:hypothetical protein